MAHSARSPFGKLSLDLPLRSMAEAEGQRAVALSVLAYVEEPIGRTFLVVVGAGLWRGPGAALGAR